MNEFDNFVNDGQVKRPMTKEERYDKAVQRCKDHIAELRKMETIDFMERPRLSEIDRKIQTQIFLANVGATHSMNIDVEEKARLICNLAKSFEEVVNEIY